jgi:hypothetical protein
MPHAGKDNDENCVANCKTFNAFTSPRYCLSRINSQIGVLIQPIRERIKLLAEVKSRHRHLRPTKDRNRSQPPRRQLVLRERFLFGLVLRGRHGTSLDLVIKDCKAAWQQSPRV